MRFLTRSETASRFAGKAVAIVGSGPGSLGNRPGFVDSHEIVVRVNNFKLTAATGFRCDVFYSFFGTSIKRSKVELKRAGVTLCLCKCPNAHAIESDWHRRHNQMIGVDYRPHYERRKNFWFCDTYIPEVGEFMAGFNLLGGHVPTTGFAAILDILSFEPGSLYLTGFDFFRSGIHNVNERWRARNSDDPIRHVPERELKWLADNVSRYPLTFDPALGAAVASVKAAA